MEIQEKSMEAHLTPPHLPHLDISHFLREYSGRSLGVCVLLAPLALIIQNIGFPGEIWRNAGNLDVGLVEGPEVLHVVLGLDHHQVNVAA